MGRTHCSHDLCFHTILALESTCEIHYPSLSVSCHVRYLPDVIVHVSRSKHQHEDETDSGPEIAVLDYREEVWVCDGAEGEQPDENGDGGDDASVVDRSRD